MKLLLDTQIVQWFAQRPERLNREEAKILASPRHSFAISAISLWEMRIKFQTSYRSGARKGEADPAGVVETLVAGGFEYTELPLTFTHCTASLSTPFDHNDPIDRLLLVQAQVEGLRLLTRDPKFAGHPFALIA